MPQIYFKAILAGTMTIDDVPNVFGWRKKTQELLDEYNAKQAANSSDNGASSGGSADASTSTIGTSDTSTTDTGAN